MTNWDARDSELTYQLQLNKAPILCTAANILSQLKLIDDKRLHSFSNINHNIMDQGDFDDVTWKNDVSSDVSRPSTAGPTSPDSNRNMATPIGRGQGIGQTLSSPHQVGRDVDPLDIAGTNGGGVIECTVTAPNKENDGTKDAYVSYLVTTNVCLPLCSLRSSTNSETD